MMTIGAKCKATTFACYIIILGFVCLYHAVIKIAVVAKYFLMSENKV